MKRSYLGICLFLLFFACSCKKNSNSLSYDTFDSLPTVSLEDVFEPITFIPLQSNDSSIISNILKICMSEDSFYILSVNPFKISKFDRAGNFISNIAREGRAEGEYLVISDIN
ncbi:MAG: 6-bladed beta-propeller [Bacteroidales bacterium]|nr:6-bladed beta-propeller [Bacteroidales bacterium]